jgi:hypothetical protein
MFARLFPIALALLLLRSLPAAATTIVPAAFAEMVAASQAIVHGRVVDVRSQMTNGRRSIHSLVRVAIIDAMKGPSAAEIVFRVPTGRIGRYRRVMVGAPEFAEGDEVVLFLTGSAPAVPVPFGLSQGVYRVNRSTGGALVTPLVPATGRSVRGDPARRPLSIDAFTRHVRTALQQP